MTDRILEKPRREECRREGRRLDSAPGRRPPPVAARPYRRRPGCRRGTQSRAPGSWDPRTSRPARALGRRDAAVGPRQARIHAESAGAPGGHGRDRPGRPAHHAHPRGDAGATGRGGPVSGARPLEGHGSRRLGRAALRLTGDSRDSGALRTGRRSASTAGVRSDRGGHR